MANTPYILTYADLINRCQDFLGGNSGISALRALRAAIQDTLRDVSQAYRWPYYTTEHRIRYDAAYSTGTVVYDHTGGAYERMLTVASGTWPTNVLYGEVVISNVAYTVDDQKSSTVITLPTSNNPGADVASTAYEWSRRMYTFPSNFIRPLSFRTENNMGIQYVNATGMLQARRNRLSASVPSVFTVRGDENLIGSMSLELCPSPLTADSLTVVYERRPRTLRIDGKQTAHTQGTISTTAASATVTGSGTGFTAAMVGAVLRIGDDATNVPTELGGIEPYLEEKVITAVASTTSITIDSTAENTQSGVKYAVSDPVDCSPAMLNAIIRGVEWHLGMHRREKDTPMLEQQYRKAIVGAMEGSVPLAGSTRFCGDSSYSAWRPADNSGS